MIDFENVRSAGLRGCEYLCADDSVTIFYSNACPNIEQGSMQHLMVSRCQLDICKLQNTGKNALDFYIASKIGQVVGSGYAGHIVIVSNDKGFSAVRDYFKKYSDGRLIVVKADIEHGILASGEISDRQQLIQTCHKSLNLEAEYEKYRERRNIQANLEQLFADTEYEEQITRIMEVVQEGKIPKTLYLNSLKKFGRQDRIYIYNRLKQIV
jgi:anthranilate/para-aminobenzoate synthase component I